MLFWLDSIHLSDTHQTFGRKVFSPAESIAGTVIGPLNRDEKLVIVVAVLR